MADNKTIAFGCDHGGYPYKDAVIEHLKAAGYEVIDYGTYNGEPSNYPNEAFAVAECVATGKAWKGILICNSGEGMAIAANKVKGIRAGIAYNDQVSELMVSHNHCNVIAFGAQFASEEEVIRRIDIFLSSVEDGGRHQHRVDMIDSYGC